jgi:hypothetical protein
MGALKCAQTSDRLSRFRHQTAPGYKAGAVARNSAPEISGLAASDQAGYVALFAEFGEAVPLMFDESFCRWSDLDYLLDAGF